MERFFKIYQTIKKPIIIVDEALTEGFGVFLKIGKFETTDHFPLLHRHSGQFATTLLCDKVDSAFVITTIRQNTNIEHHTDIVLEIRYTSDKMGVIEKFYNHLTFRPVVKYRSQRLLSEFKKRIEKWM